VVVTKAKAKVAPVPVDPVEEMNELHVELARKAAKLAMEVLESVSAGDIPVASAVALLKFGVDLERKALLGVEPDGVVDPFEALSKAMAAPAATTPEEG
jgi:hypothetical protein